MPKPKLKDELVAIAMPQTTSEIRQIVKNIVKEFISRRTVTVLADELQELILRYVRDEKLVWEVYQQLQLIELSKHDIEIFVLLPLISGKGLRIKRLLSYLEPLYDFMYTLTTYAEQGYTISVDDFIKCFDDLVPYLILRILFGIEYGTKAQYLTMLAKSYNVEPDEILECKYNDMACKCYRYGNTWIKTCSVDSQEIIVFYQRT